MLERKPLALEPRQDPTYLACRHLPPQRWTMADQAAIVILALGREDSDRSVQLTDRSLWIGSVEVVHGMMAGHEGGD